MCLARNIYFEARNQSFRGQIAVAQVTLNRVSDSRFPDSVCSVVTQAKKDRNGKPIKDKCQFSWYCDGKPDRMLESEEKYYAISIARNALMGNYLDVTNGATHYHSTAVSPYWRKQFTKVAAIEDHIFYRWDSRKRN
jgi:spore germination cell wall hydrolase CwlJ-like protein